MKHFTIRRGERPPVDPAPIGPIEVATQVTSVAVTGDEWPEMRPHSDVEIGEQVARGQTLFMDRSHREVCFVSPVSGVVETLTFGPRRTLDTLVIRVGPGEEAKPAPPEAGLRNDPRKTLLSSGFWPSFRTRPFGCIPPPEAKPDAIVVNAVHAVPQAPNPAVVLQDRLDEFRMGVQILTSLTDGIVHVCQSPGERFGQRQERVRHTSFSGTVAAGLVGTQIDRLCRGMSVWSIGYQDVAAIGHFFTTGEYIGQRVVSVTGPMASPPRLLNVPLGARMADLFKTTSAYPLSGGPNMGREAVFLGRSDEQITLQPSAPGARRHLSRSGRYSLNAAIPTRALDHSIAIDVLTIPLLRALSVGDANRAERLGCLALVEEDLAAATRICTSGTDYSACLRRVLTELRAEVA